jgi:hypothetical protein
MLTLRPIAKGFGTLDVGSNVTIVCATALIWSFDWCSFDLNNYWERCPERERVFPVLWSYTTFVCTNEGRSLSDRHKDLAETGASECGSVRADVTSRNAHREGGKGANEDRLYVHLDWCRHDKPRARLGPQRRSGARNVQEYCAQRGQRDARRKYWRRATYSSFDSRTSATESARKTRKMVTTETLGLCTEKSGTTTASDKDARYRNERPTSSKPKKRTGQTLRKNSKEFPAGSTRPNRTPTRRGVGAVCATRVYTFSDASGWSCQLLYACLRD